MNILQFLFQNLKHQEKHHQKKTFQQEYQEFIEKYNFEKLKAKE